MHRQFSLEPFQRHYTHNPNRAFLDYMVTKEDGSVCGMSSSLMISPFLLCACVLIVAFSTIVDPAYAKEMHVILTEYHRAKEQNMLLQLDFVTLSDYLFKLQSACHILARLGNKSMYYLAAAVSDFFIPSQKMVMYRMMRLHGNGIHLFI